VVPEKEYGLEGDPLAARYLVAGSQGQADRVGAEAVLGRGEPTHRASYEYTVAGRQVLLGRALEEGGVELDRVREDDGSRLDLDDADRDAVEAGCLGDRAYHEVLRVYELSDGHRLVRVVEAGELELHGLEDLLELLPLENDEVARSLEILGDDLGDGVAEIGIADRGVDIVEVGDRDGASLRRLGG